MSFSEYVAHYGTARSEGLLAALPFGRVQSARAQNVPEEMKSQALRDLSEWLGEMVRQVDSSLLDEWELLSHPEQVQEALARGGVPRLGRSGAGPAPLTANVRAFRVMVRNACFRRAELAAKRDWASSASWTTARDWDAHAGRLRSSRYFAEHASIGTGLAARGGTLWQVSELGRRGAPARSSTTPPGTTNGRSCSTSTSTRPTRRASRRYDPLASSVCSP